MREFYWVWRRLACEGACDGVGGSQYLRVRDEWENAGRPADIDSFIRRRAGVNTAEERRQNQVDHDWI